MMHSKNSSASAVSVCYPTHRRYRGFALISTISVMVLLVMVALAMLSLSTIELRQDGHERYRKEARANARMALMIALGELQKYAGPDQRVTATADIHKGTDQEKKHLLGVWSTKDWDPANPKKRDLLTWLATVPVEDKQNPSLADMESGLSAYPFAGSDLVTVVGRGTLGDGRDEDHVRVATLPVKNTKGDVAGTYAYWTSDESTKASYAVPESETESKWADASRLGLAPRTGLEVLNEAAFSGYEAMMKKNTGVGSTPSYQTFDLMFPAEDKHSGKYFHALTHRTLSLVTNTRHGGMKSDLSTAFELDLAEFNAIEEFHNSGEQNRTENYDAFNPSAYNQDEFYPSKHKLGYLFEVEHGDGMVRGPTWDLLRNHYRLYKKDWQDVSWPRGFKSSDDKAFVSRGALPLSYSNNRGDDEKGYQVSSPESPFGERANPSAVYGGRLLGGAASYDSLAQPYSEGEFDVYTSTTRATAARVMPMVVRVTLVLGLRRIPDPTKSNPDNWHIGVTLDPYVTLCNPYNRPIEFESIGVFAAKMRPMVFFCEYTNTAGKKKKVGPLHIGDNFYTRGSLAYRLMPPESGLHRLEPGEIKVMSPQTDSPDDYENNEFGYKDSNVVEASFDYTENSGIYIIPGGENKKIIPKEGTEVTVKMCGRYPKMGLGKNRGDKLIVTQHYAKGHSGDGVDLYDHLPKAGDNLQANRDVFDDPVISEIDYSTFDFNVNSKNEIENHSLYAEVKLQESSIPEVGQSGLYFGALDVRMKHGMQDAPVFHQFNPRAQVQDPRNYDGSDRLDTAWQVKLTPLTDVSELNLVGAEERGFWGSGFDSTSGTSKVVLFDLPWAPSTSLASLSQADIAILPSSGASTIGNSFPNPALQDLKQVVGQRNLQGPHTDRNPQPQVDFSWAANEALWDQYYYSSINWGEGKLDYQGDNQPYETQNGAVDALITGSGAMDSPLSNPRVRFMPGFASGDNKDELKDYKTIGKHLAVLGGFNVNSTSVEAWRSVLSGLRNSEVTYLGDSGSLEKSESDVPFSRFLLPAGDEDDLYSGYRNLSDKEITELAEAMVEQVRARGPFMGLADFVNRRLTTDSVNGNDIGMLGAMQSAIEKTSINDHLRNNVTVSNVENRKVGLGGKSINISTLTGAPGYLMQADVLNSVGSILRTRSDTFVVRAYGDARDKAGNVKARSWCEATIQRYPEWVEPTNEPFKKMNETYPDFGSQSLGKRWKDNPAFPSANRTFGRRMKVVSFRWLSKEEI